MQSTMLLRPATAEDLESIRACVIAAYEPYVQRIGVRPASMDRDFLPAIVAGSVFICELDGQVVGTLVVVADGDRLEVSSVSVRPELQSRGLGKRLMTMAESIAQSGGHRALYLYTNAALPDLVEYYQRLGYRVVGRAMEGSYDRIFMEKFLPDDG